MLFHDLQSIVIVETICLMLIIGIIIAAFRRWKRTLIALAFMATLAFFSAWSSIMAFGSMLVYGSASTLLWWQLDTKPHKSTMSYRILQKLNWAILASGVAILILNNLNNIFIYLRH